MSCKPVALLLASAAAVAAPVAAQAPDADRLEAEMRQHFLDKPGVAELLERDADVKRRFDLWIVTLVQERIAAAAAPPPTHASLRRELLTRMKKDQEVRRERDKEAWSQVDKENQQWLSDVIDEYGWPGKSMVGADGANAAWLIAQHAIGAPALQRRCLELMQAAGPGEVTPRNVAYLIDRTRMAEGEPQLYGTQFVGVGEATKLHPIEEPAMASQRREQMEMMPLEVYLLVLAAQSKAGP